MCADREVSRSGVVSDWFRRRGAESKWTDAALSQPVEVG